jgi:deoxyribose-phosphate aldolase
MTDKEIISRIDHTLLKPEAVWGDVEKLCREALSLGTASVCIGPSFVKDAKGAFPDLNVCTVIGFPLGYNTTASKIAESVAAIGDGASELDMVINIGWAKAGEFSRITEEIKALRKVSSGHILKVIIETCYLSESEKIALCGCVSEAGADFIKTSTGFGSAGAQLEDISLFRAHLGPGVKIKAAGGIRTREAMEAFIEAGAERIGSSSAAAIFAL